jgi:hypothetical protein
VLQHWFLWRIGGRDVETNVIGPPAPVNAGSMPRGSQRLAGNRVLLDSSIPARVAEQCPGGRAHQLGCLVAWEASDVRQPDERFDPGCGADGEHQAAQL